jgi:hypothetical protein
MTGQGIFRFLKELIKRDNIKELRDEYNNLKFKHSFNRAIEMIFNSKAAGSKKKLAKKDATLYQKNQYWFNHKDLELFFENMACNFLFRKYAKEIAQRGKIFVEGRNKKVLSKKVRDQKTKGFIDMIENLRIIAVFFYDIAKEQQREA